MCHVKLSIFWRWCNFLKRTKNLQRNIIKGLWWNWGDRYMLYAGGAASGGYGPTAGAGGAAGGGPGGSWNSWNMPQNGPPPGTQPPPQPPQPNSSQPNSNSNPSGPQGEWEVTHTQKKNSHKNDKIKKDKLVFPNKFSFYFIFYKNNNNSKPFVSFCFILSFF